MDQVTKQPAVLSDETSNLIRLFHEDCRLRKLVSTMDYIYRAREFCAFLDGRGRKPLEVDRNDLKAFLAHLQDRGLKYSTIDRLYSCLSAFYEFLIAEDFTQENPILPFRRRYLRKFKKDNHSETRKLIEVEEASRLINSILDTRDRCILVILLKTGLRVGELTRIDVGDIDLNRGELRIKPTPKRTNLLVYLDDECITVLQKWLAARKGRKGSDGPALFLNKSGDRISRRSIEEFTTKHATRVGLHNPNAVKLEDKFTPHCTRHFFSTHLIRSGMPMHYVDILRGDTLGDAIGRYIHIDERDLKQSYLAHIPRLGI
ncbi:MAG: tyrosine-type recombinase/integrase [Methanothrix sp.]